MQRVKFKKGFQRKFLINVLEKINCPSFYELVNRVDVNYSSLKNYFNESRTLPKNFFEDLCRISEINKASLKFIILEENWGKIKGGKKSKRK